MWPELPNSNMDLATFSELAAVALIGSRGHLHNSDLDASSKCQTPSPKDLGLERKPSSKTLPPNTHTQTHTHSESMH